MTPQAAKICHLIIFIIVQLEKNRHPFSTLMFSFVVYLDPKLKTLVEDQISWMVYLLCNVNKNELLC